VVLSFGKPLIVTNVGGLPEFVKDANFVVEPNNPRSLSDKLLTALRDDNLIKKLSADSTSLAEEYSWDKVAQQTIHAYQYILKEE
jgi:glycosyltransferase involved in cell wall biosynthesis